jgi:hypothetical protein
VNIVIEMTGHQLKDNSQEKKITTKFCQFSGAIANPTKGPMFILAFGLA